MTERIRHRPCPECGGPTKPIVYGLPGPELERRAQLGHVVLGGCCVSKLSPTHFCPACRREMESPEPTSRSSRPSFTDTRAGPRAGTRSDVSFSPRTRPPL